MINGERSRRPSLRPTGTPVWRWDDDPLKFREVAVSRLMAEKWNYFSANPMMRHTPRAVTSSSLVRMTRTLTRVFVRAFILSGEHDIHTVGRHYFKRAGRCRHRQRVRINAKKQRAADALPFSVIANSLADGEDMPLVKGTFNGGAAMPRGAERNPLLLH